MSLRAQALSGIRWTTFSSIGCAALQILQVSILARLLQPSDFGLMAITTAVMAFLQTFSDFGISSAIIHNQKITARQLSTLYWFNVGTGGFLAMCVALGSGLIAELYGEPKLQTLFMLAALTLFINSLSQQIKTLAQKDLKFSALSKIELATAAVGLLSGSLIALKGGGAYSLAASGAISAAANFVLLRIYIGKSGAAFEFQLDEIRPFLRYGFYVVGKGLAGSLYSQLDVLIGGHLIGAQSIGFYSVPKTLSLRIAGIVNPIITKVGFPVMARSQNDTPLLRKVYLETIAMTAAVNFPIYVFMTIFAQDIVSVLLGAKWASAAPLLQIFAVWALIRSTGNPIGSLVMAKGRPDLELKWILFWLVTMPPGLLIASHFGATGMALGLLIMMAATIIPNWYYLVRPLCEAGLWEYLARMRTPLLLSLAAGIPAKLLSEFASIPLARLAIAAATGGITYVALSFFVNKTWVNAMDDLVLGGKLARMLTSRRLKNAASHRPDI